MPAFLETKMAMYCRVTSNLFCQLCFYTWDSCH